MFGRVVFVIALLFSQAAKASTEQEINCLVEAVYFESRDENVGGQLAVAFVVMNRVKDKRWPSSVCGVVHQKNQFSYYWDGKK